MICQICQDIVLRSIESRHLESPKQVVKRFRHHPSTKDLTNSARARCIMCATLWLGFTTDEQQALVEYEQFPDPASPVLTEMSIRNIDVGFILSIQLSVRTAQSTGIRNRDYGFHAYAGMYVVWPKFLPKRNWDFLLCWLDIFRGGIISANYESKVD